MPSLHIAAEQTDIAPIVLMPGDPLRAKWMSERLLEKPKQINAVRNMLGYTGTYSGHCVTIMGSGMGMPSMGIYSYELFAHYDVDTIVRVGTCGAIQSRFNIGDIILAQTVSTDSSFLQQHNMPGHWTPTPSWKLLKSAHEYCVKKAIIHEMAGVLSSDFFYHPQPDSWKRWANLGVACIEMETAALYANAARIGKLALAVLTVSDCLPKGERATTQQREQSFFQMFDIALGATTA